MENLPPPFPSPSPLQPPPPRLRIGAVIRDVAILWALTLGGGFVIGFVQAMTHPGVRPPVVLLALSNLGLTTVAFTVAGSLVPPAVRWPHLGVVALLAWLSSLVNVVFGMSLLVWVFSVVFIVMAMVLGGALSYLFNRGPRPMA